MDPNSPVISNLRANFGGRCTVSSSVPGTIETLAFEFADADGNVRGGTLENTTGGLGATVTNGGGIPSPGIGVTGSPTSGTITITACLFFGSSPGVMETVTVTDASGKVSNTLRLEVPRPGGAPLLPRDGDHKMWKSL